jgi:fluoroacetyl-CoA thioesterase
MSLEEIQPGLKHRHSIVVDESLTVSAVSKAFSSFADMPPVFATAFLVGFAEWTCIEALRPYLSLDQRTVGVHVDLSHSGATPVGMTVTAEVELVAVEGRRLRFKVTCMDDVEVVSEGYHERHIIDMPRFMDRLARKASRPLTEGAG